jgi:hypothetical protein
MPFCDAVAQFNYWSKNPPLHLMIKAFLGIEGEETEQAENNPAAMAEAVRLLGPPRAGGVRVEKLADAPEIDRKRFEQLKRQNAG